MGNSLITLSPCLTQMGNCNYSSRSSSKVKLIFFEGTTTILTGKHIVAGEIMFQNPDKIICHADSFFIGHPLPCLGIDDQLSPGRTYFVLPLDRFNPSSVVSASSLSALSSTTNSPINFGSTASSCPFQYIKAHDGRVLIKVLPEFIIGLINRGKQDNFVANNSNNQNHLCSTPELKKHYDQLVRSKDQTWSPKLDTIAEQKIRLSPYSKLLGFDWKQKMI